MKENVCIDLEEVLYRLRVLYNYTFGVKTAFILENDAYFDDMRKDIQYIIEELKK